MPTLTLVRHGPVRIARGHVYGQLDVPTTSLDIPWRPSGDFVCYSSPLQRCRHLAWLFCRTPIIDPRLMELNFGHWEGKPWPQPGNSAFDNWCDDPWRTRVPGGESYADVIQRIEIWLSSLPADKNIVAVTHAGVIRAVFHLLHGLEPLESLKQPVNYFQYFTYSL